MHVLHLNLNDIKEMTNTAQVNILQRKKCLPALQMPSGLVLLQTKAFQ